MTCDVNKHHTEYQLMLRFVVRLEKPDRKHKICVTTAFETFKTDEYILHFYYFQIIKELKMIST